MIDGKITGIRIDGDFGNTGLGGISRGRADDRAFPFFGVLNVRRAVGAFTQDAAAVGLDQTCDLGEGQGAAGDQVGKMTVFEHVPVSDHR